MARGWESKSIEAQQEEVARQAHSPLPTTEELERRSRRRTIELTRARAANDLARATAPAHRRMLEQALEALDEQLAAEDQAAH
jgi:hypothetical protein